LQIKRYKRAELFGPGVSASFGLGRPRLLFGSPARFGAGSLFRQKFFASSLRSFFFVPFASLRAMRFPLPEKLPEAKG
jgi:hypothetical protein